MNIIFLSSESTHHFFLINEIHKVFPVKSVFFQTIHAKQRSWRDKLKRWRKINNVCASIKGLANRLLFGNEAKLEENYEREKLFLSALPALNPLIPSKKIFSFNDAKSVEEVKSENPDIIIVFGTDILKGDILQTAKLGILNIHRGIAPAYCGGGVTEWALCCNDFDGIGVTIHVCSDQLDGGDIVGQRKYQIQSEDKIYMLRAKTTIVALELLKEVLSNFEKGSVDYHRQQHIKIWKSSALTILQRIKARKNLKQFIKKQVIL